MDALAGYGSDSSSASGQGETKDTEPKPSGLCALLGSDISEASDNDEQLSQPSATSLTSPPLRKRPKTEVEPTQPTLASVLPCPPLTDCQAASSIIHWPVNYLQLPPSEAERLAELSCNPQELQIKLQRLADTVLKSQKKSCWAEHCRSQQEFHNPHFFATVVDHFGITDPLGSQMSEENPAVSTAEGGDQGSKKSQNEPSA